MTLSKEFIEKIQNCPWLKNCGQKDAFEFDVEYVKDIKAVDKHINSMKWENLCLDKKGDFTVYLCINHKEEYQCWNDLAKEVKSEYMPAISDEVMRILAEKEMPESVLADVKMNVLSIFMLEYYSEYYSSEFYDNMLKIYLAGHLPCGWKGSSEDGKFLVY